MYILVSPFSKTFDEVGLIYHVPDFLAGEIKPGMIVEIPIKDTLEIAVILDTFSNAPDNIDLKKIKDVENIKNDLVFLSNAQINLLKWVSSYYFSLLHNATNLFFPKNLREKILKGTFDISKAKDKQYGFDYDDILSPKQQEALNKIQSFGDTPILFHGVTGSGKTEIYIKLIADLISQGKQVLFLIPEIILTNQLSARLQKVFGEDIIVLNSTVSEAKKTQYWMDIHTGKAKLIIGTRSSLFYPYNNLGMIIIDEEHDNSYISDNTPRYHAIEVAEKISQDLRIPLLMGSGTPSVSSMYKAVKGDYKLVSLFEKYKKQES